MSPYDGKNNQIQNVNRRMLSELVIKHLHDLGFKLEKRGFSFPHAKFKLRIDFLFRRGKKRYSVAVKSSRKMQLALMHLLPRAILRLQAESRSSRFLPILAIAVPMIEPRDIRRVAEYMDFYAPEMGWLLIDEHGRAVFMDKEKDQYAFLNAGKVEWIESLPPNDFMFSKNLQISVFDNIAVSDEQNMNMSRASSSSSRSSSSLSSIFPDSYSSSYSSSKMQLSFSDLEQWLLKVFLMSSSDVASDYWGGPKGYAENAFQLSKIANVSRMAANLWAQAMESSSYLKRIRRKEMILLRPKAILEEWVGRYRFSDNRIYPYRSMFPVSNPDAFFKEILNGIRRYNKELGSLAIAAHRACELHGIKHSSAKSNHIYCLGNIEKLAEILNLVPSDVEHKVDLFLVEPKYPKSVFGGILQKKGIPVCDILQCYLDLYHLPDRGREQANSVYENVISNIIRIRQGG